MARRFTTHKTHDLTQYIPVTCLLRGPATAMFPLVGELDMSLEPILIGGIRQWLTFEGDNCRPLLLYLHGGPGAAELPVAKRFQAPLLKTWRVINWDQRGAGKSPAKEVSLERLVADTFELAGLLKRRHPGRALYILGHSWGSLLGLIALQRHPELCDGFISVGQLVAGTENEVCSHQLAIRRARVTALAPVRYGLRAEPPPYGAHAGALLRKCLYLYLLGGFFRRRRYALSLLLTLLGSREYTAGEKLSYLWRFRLSLERLQPDIEKLNLLTAALELKVPALFCIGRHDLVTPPELAVRLFEHTEAPYKRLEVFEGEGHCLHYENPQRFAETLQNWLANSNTAQSWH